MDRLIQPGGRQEIFPKINSADRRSARTIREVDLFSLERSSDVFMRGLRAPRQNLSENLVRNFGSSDAFSANGAASRLARGIALGDSIVKG
jgi:hypothetical protein